MNTPEPSILIPASELRSFMTALDKASCQAATAGKFEAAFAYGHCLLQLIALTQLVPKVNDL